jgi:hypothetical protein
MPPLAGSRLPSCYSCCTFRTDSLPGAYLEEDERAPKWGLKRGREEEEEEEEEYERESEREGRGAPGWDSEMEEGSERESEGVEERGAWESEEEEEEEEGKEEPVDGEATEMEDEVWGGGGAGGGEGQVSSSSSKAAAVPPKSPIAQRAAQALQLELLRTNLLARSRAAPTATNSGPSKRYKETSQDTPLFPPPASHPGGGWR